MHNLGRTSYEEWPTNGSIPGTLLIEMREMLWHQKKNEIQDWMDSKTLAFAQEESAGKRLSTENWVDEYIYILIFMRYSLSSSPFYHMNGCQY